tara:strand:- start:2510 stop:3196 length:687 start_codon:yes stop_codon:yes gene_type:complete
MQYRYDLVQYFIDTYKYKNYLEIGYRRGDTFKRTKCKSKWSIDPNSNPDTGKHEATFKMTSDKFFEKVSSRSLNHFREWYTDADEKPKIFDIIFIDGAHDKDSVRKDILNSLDHLRKGGIVVCHDVCPLEKRLLDPDACHNAWEAFAELRSERTDLLFYSIPVNHCGFILLNDGSKKHSDYNTMPEDVKDSLFNLSSQNLSDRWKFLNSNRKDLLNYIDLETFYNKFN